MPRRKPDKVTEVRATLGTYERQLEQDKLTMQGINSATNLAGSVAQGLGLGGGLVVAAFLWGKDIEKLFEQFVGIWPESGTLFSPEWIAKWGDDPSEILGESLGDGDNDVVDELKPIVTPQGDVSLEGLSPYSVYSLAYAGRAANYDWRKANIIKQYTALHGVGIYPGSDEEKTIIAEWHSVNKKPPTMLTFDQCADQIGLRITCARIDAGPSLFLGFQYLFNERNPSMKDNYVSDPLLDWLAYTEPRGHAFLVEGALKVNIMDKASPKPYDYSQRRYKGIKQIALYAHWAPPPTAP